MNTKKTPSTIDREALYYQAIQMAYDTFLEEEKKGQIFTELRLMEAIKAARTLYKPFKQKVNAPFQK